MLSDITIPSPAHLTSRQTRIAEMRTGADYTTGAFETGHSVQLRLRLGELAALLPRCTEPRSCSGRGVMVELRTHQWDGMMADVLYEHLPQHGESRYLPPQIAKCVDNLHDYRRYPQFEGVWEPAVAIVSAGRNDATTTNLTISASGGVDCNAPMQLDAYPRQLRITDGGAYDGIDFKVILFRSLARHSIHVYLEQNCMTMCPERIARGLGDACIDVCAEPLHRPIEEVDEYRVTGADRTADPVDIHISTRVRAYHGTSERMRLLPIHGEHSSIPPPPKSRWGRLVDKYVPAWCQSIYNSLHAAEAFQGLLVVSGFHLDTLHEAIEAIKPARAVARHARTLVTALESHARLVDGDAPSPSRARQSNADGEGGDDEMLPLYRAVTLTRLPTAARHLAAGRIAISRPTTAPRRISHPPRYETVLGPAPDYASTMAFELHVLAALEEHPPIDDAGSISSASSSSASTSRADLTTTGCSTPASSTTSFASIGSAGTADCPVTLLD